LSYLDRNLLTNEKVLFRTRLHWRLYVIPVLSTVLVLLPLGWLVWAQGQPAWSPLPAGLGLLWLLAAHIRRRSSEFAVTNKRVVIKIGVFTTRSLELLPSKVEGVAVEQDLWGKLFNFGDIVVTGSGGTKESFAGIQAPFAFRRAIQEATEPSATPAKE
jgi:uncharacterized membrane protein YdbT with pleckstrin-like domain